MITLGTMLRHWPLGLAAAALMFATFAHVGRLKAERDLERAKAEVGAAYARVERQNEAIEELRRDGARRAAVQAEQLRAARSLNQKEAPMIERLRQSADQARSNQDCSISDALRQAEGKL